ncbi:thioredoxin-dependent thiol peroxidase [soil metagenome]
MTLHKGDRAPDFELRDADGETWRLSKLRRDRVIVYFYPADDTPGCTAQACDFRDAQGALQHAGYIVLGISPQGEESHRAFARKFALNFPLLVDDDYEVARSYGVNKDRSFWRDVPLDVKRSTFVIDADGIIVEAMYGVKAKGHVSALQDALRASEDTDQRGSARGAL